MVRECCYGREELVEAAANQMRQLPYYNAFFKTSHPAVAELSKRLASLAPDGLNHVFYANMALRRMIRLFVWYAISGRSKVSLKNGLLLGEIMAITAQRFWPLYGRHVRHV